MFLPFATPSTRYIKDLAASVDADAEFVKLDSVGGTTLYITAEAIRQGVNFPVRHIIGSQWDCEGCVFQSLHAKALGRQNAPHVPWGEVWRVGFLSRYDGIETEGLCYMAEPLGFGCWAMLHATVVHEGYHPARS